MPPCARLCLLASLLLPLAAPAPAPSSPAERANIGLRKQIAAPEVLLRATVSPADEVTQSLDVADSEQALVCSQILGVLPYRTFRRQRFDSFTSCTCVSPMTAVCQPDTYYPTVAPGTPEAALAQEHAPLGAGGHKFIEVLNAFSVQQTCFFEHLRGQKLSPPRPCAFSWARAGRPACDCAQPPAPGAQAEAAAAEAQVTPAEEAQVTPAEQAEAPATPQAPAATAATPEAVSPATERANKSAVQSVQRSGETAAVAPGQRMAQEGEEEEEGRRPAVSEESHLRRARRFARRH